MRTQLVFAPPHDIGNLTWRICWADAVLQPFDTKGPVFHQPESRTLLASLTFTNPVPTPYIILTADGSSMLNSFGAIRTIGP